jgi:heptosyltransferase-2
MRILLLQTAFLGDVVLATPLIGALKQRYPEAELWMMVTPAAKDLVKNDPRLTGVLTFDKRGTESGVFGLMRLAKRLQDMNFARAYALQRSARTSLLLWLAKIPVRIGFSSATLSFLYSERPKRQKLEHDVLRNLCLLAGEGPQRESDTELALYPSPWEELSPKLKERLGAAERARVVMFPGSSWHTKMWHSGGFRSVAKHFSGLGMQVIALGAKSERGLCESVTQETGSLNLAGEASLGESMTILSQAHVAICNDSMALQMASACKVPTVAVFCATSPSFGFGPWKNRAVVVERDDLACKPCSRHGTRKCPLNHEACMRGVGSKQVINAASELMGGACA